MSEAAGIRLIALALAAAAALVVFGCGGDSATETASTPSSLGASSAAKAPQDKPSSSSSSSGPSASKQAQSQTAAQAGNPAAESGVGKQGPHITPPKGPQEPAPTSRERAEATVASMTLSSPALAPGPESTSALPTTYTCDGKDTWPELKWRGVPAGTAELALLVLNLEPVNEALFFDWVVAGLDPSLESLDSGRLPKGAVVGQNGFGQNGYSVCPPKGQETIIFALYALPQPLAAHKGFDPAALRKQILAMSGDTGLLAVTYARG
jgi:phosphatidylethanolamine-binding protein (PEBP) family uncharacterized protein